MSRREETSALERRNESAVERRNLARNRRAYSPNVDIVETSDEVLVFADMPGVGSENLDIHFENGELFLHGKVAERIPEGAKLISREYGFGDFYRVFTISEQVDSEKITAEYRDGVLVLHLPKVEAAKPRKIKVVAKSSS